MKADDDNKVAKAGFDNTVPFSALCRYSLSYFFFISLSFLSIFSLSFLSFLSIFSLSFLILIFFPLSFLMFSSFSMCPHLLMFSCSRIFSQVSSCFFMFFHVFPTEYLVSKRQIRNKEDYDLYSALIRYFSGYLRKQQR